MTDSAIQLHNISKKYRIGVSGKNHDTLSALIIDSLQSPIRNLRRLRQLTKFSDSGDDADDVIWALRDVSFGIRRGEVVGIIGRNGAGKSTLLKILARITYPSSGRAELHGRISSLLEVGTGFHPELTGRENIYLNGTILGMRKVEIDRKFDEIVAFSGVEKFINTPVKWYSSGMRVRLAFSVAAHLEPEILLVDEVLAVGDAEFQKKCLGKMEDVAKKGRTVLFVSHQMAAIQNLCPRTILMRAGRILEDGNTSTVIDKYLIQSREDAQMTLGERVDRSGSGVVRFSMIKMKTSKGEYLSSLKCGDDVILEVWFENSRKQEIKNFHLAIGIDDPIGQRITVLSNEITQDLFPSLPDSANCIEVHIKHLPLIPGQYGFTLFSKVDGIISDWVKNAGYFDVDAGDFFNSGKMLSANQGTFMLDHHFYVSDQDREKHA